jgi:hypothetical protein
LGFHVDSFKLGLEWVVKQNSFPLRLPASLQAEARKTADQEGVSLNQLFNLAIAEKISVLRTEEFFRVRAAGADVARARYPKACRQRTTAGRR